MALWLTCVVIFAASLVVPVATSARVRVSITFLWRHGYLPDLARPRTYCEWVQWRKLKDRDLSLAILTDKLHAKSVAAQAVGASLVVPTYWHGDHLPRMAPWPTPFVVKANHGCRQFVVVRCADDWQVALRAAPQWLTATYGKWLDEWHYRCARRTILVEPFIGPEEGLPVDYKVFVFGGRAEFVQVHLDRHANHRWFQLDRDWRRMSGSPNDQDPDRPLRLNEMLEAAELIAGDRDHLRVDFYEVEGRLWFGEFCLFPGSGLDPFHPNSLDEIFGRYWTKAVEQRGSANA